MSVHRSWKDGDQRSRSDQLSRKGGSIIIAHVGSRESDLLLGAGLSLVGIKSTGAYHKYMNLPTWMSWLEDDVLPKSSGGVLVIDRAPFHLTVTNDARPATTTMQKEKFVEWLVRHDAVPPSWVFQDWQQRNNEAHMKAEADMHRPAPWYQV